MYVYLTNLHTLWKLKSSYKDGALDPIFGNSALGGPIATLGPGVQAASV